MNLDPANPAQIKINIYLIQHPMQDLGQFLFRDLDQEIREIVKNHPFLGDRAKLQEHQQAYPRQQGGAFLLILIVRDAPIDNRP
jgi:hypothetical protein